MAERRERIGQADSVRFLTLLFQLPIVIEYERPEQIIRDLLTLAHQNNLSSYDVSYLNLAMRKGVPIATLYKKLIEAARAVDVEIFLA